MPQQHGEHVADDRIALDVVGRDQLSAAQRHHRVVVASTQPGQRLAIVGPVGDPTRTVDMRLGVHALSDTHNPLVVPDLQQSGHAVQVNVDGSETQPVGVALPGARRQLCGVVEWSVHVTDAPIGRGDV